MGTKRDESKPAVNIATHSAARSDRGVRRTENQDSFAVYESEAFSLYVLADGMGGQKGGGQAAKIAVDTVIAYVEKTAQVSAEILEQAFFEANSAVLAKARSNPALAKMGTTLVALAVSGSDIYVAHVGDSRAYRLNGDEFGPITEDHTIVSELIRSGTLTPEQARQSSISHILTRSIGADEDLKVDSCCLDQGAQLGDKFLLCSDGLYAVVSDPEIQTVLRNLSVDEAADLLVERANEKGGPDNVTIVALEVVAPGQEVELPRRAHSTRIERKAELRTLLQDEIRAVRPKRRYGLTLSGLRRRVAGLTIAITLVCFFLGYYVGLSTRPLLPTSAKTEQPVSLSETLSTLNLLDSTEPPLSQDSASQSLPESLDANVAALIDGEAAATQEALNAVRIKIEITTRRLALWHARQEALETVDLLALASSVAVSSPGVREQRDEYERLNSVYLREAEQLVYNPLDRTQEIKVQKLIAERAKLRRALEKSVRAYIKDAIDASLQSLIELTHARDRMQARLHSTSSLSGSD